MTTARTRPAALDPESLAARLCEAQVAWQLAELKGRALRKTITTQVDLALDLASRHRLADLVALDQLKATLSQSLAGAAANPFVAELAREIALTVHTWPEADQHSLAQIVERDDVEALVGAILDLRELQERGLDRIAASPLVGAVAAGFVTRIVADVLATNTALARKLPGMSSLLAVGVGAAGIMKGVADKQVGPLLGDAMGKGGEFAIRRTNSAILAVLADGPVLGAVMESWDLQASEPMGGLAHHLAGEDFDHLLGIVHRLVTTALTSAYVAGLVDACLDRVLDLYGDLDGAAFLAAAGLDRRTLISTAEIQLKPVVARLLKSGDLEEVIRRRLTPFYASPDVAALLTSAE